MMYNYVLIDKDDLHDSISFLKLEDAVAYQKAFKNNWELIKTKHITHVNAQKYIDWNDVPKHLSFIYKDHEGIWASQYLPSRQKWYTKNNSMTYRMYGGERVKLEYRYYHELIKIGDMFENSSNNRHFINWNKIKGSYALKFIDVDEQIIEVFNDSGELLFSGSNDDVNFLNKKQSLQFNVFPWQTYTFIKS